MVFIHYNITTSSSANISNSNSNNDNNYYNNKNTNNCIIQRISEVPLKGSKYNVLLSVDNLLDKHYCVPIYVLVSFE